jgi:GNAT superfamily N-acetyltransferase
MVPMKATQAVSREPAPRPAAGRSGAPPAVSPVEGRRDLRDFLALPHRLYADDPHYVPALAIERRRHLDPRTNPYFQRAEACLWLARREGRPVGRISAQIDHEALSHREDGSGHFGLLEAEDDPEVFASLLATAESWLQARGVQRISGPFNLSINDECGLLVDGFDSPAMLMMPHGRPYYGDRLKEAGYTGVRDLLAYHVEVGASLPEAGIRLVRRVREVSRVTVRPIRWRRYEEEIATIVDIFNDAWADNWGFVPLSGARLDHLARNLKPIVIDELVAIAEVDGQPAGMLVGLPNVNEALADLGGRLLPLGWLKLLWRLKAGRIRTVRVPLMGVRRRYRGTLLGGALMVMMFERVRAACYRRGIRAAELSWVLEDNRAMRHVAEAMGSRVYKRYRLYEKALAQGGGARDSAG